MLAMCIIHYIDGLAWGVVLSIERESRPAVAIILTVPRFLFLVKFLPGLGE